jgi:hypothetical protein
MTCPVAVAGPANSIAVSRARDRLVEWLLGLHPATAAMLVSVGLFPTKGKALRRLNRLAAKGRVRFVGTVRRKAGRPEHVFCKWLPKADDLRHEVELTDLCLRLDAGQILRGPDVTDQAIRPDAEARINGRLYYVELDRGTMGYRQMERRLRLYEGCTDFVLWVCPTRDRRDELRARAGRIRGIALFATFAEATASPHAPVWIDVGGAVGALPRQGVVAAA